MKKIIINKTLKSEQNEKNRRMNVRSQFNSKCLARR